MTQDEMILTAWDIANEDDASTEMLLQLTCDLVQALYSVEVDHGDVATTLGKRHGAIQ